MRPLPKYWLPYVLHAKRNPTTLENPFFSSSPPPHPSKPTYDHYLTVGDEGIFLLWTMRNGQMQIRSQTNSPQEIDKGFGGSIISVLRTVGHVRKKNQGATNPSFPALLRKKATISVWENGFRYTARTPHKFFLPSLPLPSAVVFIPPTMSSHARFSHLIVARNVT